MQKVIVQHTNGKYTRGTAGTGEAQPASGCRGLSRGTSEVHVAPDVVDLFHHLPDVFSPSRKSNPSQKAAQNSAGRETLRMVEAVNGSSASHPRQGCRLPWDPGAKSTSIHLLRVLLSGAACPVLQPPSPSMA